MTGQTKHCQGKHIAPHAFLAVVMLSFSVAAVGNALRARTCSRGVLVERLRARPGSCVRASAGSGGTMPGRAAAVSSRPRNVLGSELMCCCTSPRTGFYRDGFCQTGPQDVGRHTVCARVTTAFLEYSRSRGNDLMTPMPAYSFPGLRDGDKWCLCVSRWKEALDAGVAPPVVLEATHAAALDVVTLEQLRANAITS